LHCYVYLIKVVNIIIKENPFGEIGKHDRLKICSSYKVEGSSPSMGIKYKLNKYIHKFTTLLQYVCYYQILIFEKNNSAG
jgi:hypothetical protein